MQLAPTHFPLAHLPTKFLYQPSLSTTRFPDETLFLFLSALRANPMRQLRRAAVLADEQPLLFHSQMRPPAAHFTLAMMFYWYATHS